MKNLSIKLLILLSLVGIMSCKKVLDKPNPNAPSAIDLATPRAGLSNMMTGELARYSALLTQQMKNGDEVNFRNLYALYAITNADYKYIYENAYTRILNPASNIDSDESKLISALTYVYLDGTFSNAYKLSEQGEEALTEADVFALLDPVINGGGSLANAAKVTKAQWYLNHGDYASALTLVQGFSKADEYVYETLGNLNNDNNWQQYKNQRQGYMENDPFAKTFFTGADTNLYKLYFDYATGEVFADDTIKVEVSRTLGFEHAAQDVKMVSYSLARLIEAEATARAGGDATAILSDIMQNLYTDLGATGTAEPITAGGLDEVKIVAQKVLFGHPQQLFNFRRWKAEDGSFIPGFTEKVTDGFPEKHYYIVQ